MGAGDVVAIVASVVVAVLVGVLLATTVFLVRALRELRRAVADLREQTLPLVAEMHEAMADAAVEIERVDRLVSTGEAIGEGAERASRLAYRTLSSPVVKVMALGAGVSRASQRLRAGTPRRRGSRSGSARTMGRGAPARTSADAARGEAAAPRGARGRRAS